jgi:hypothetical protein
LAEARTIEEENAVAKAQRLAKIRDRARLFHDILGSDRGKVILDELRQAFGYSRTAGIPPNQLDDNGRVDELQTWRKMGEYSVIRWIEIQLEWKETLHEQHSGGGN